MELFSKVQVVELDKALEKEVKGEKEKEKTLVGEETEETEDYEKSVLDKSTFNYSHLCMAFILMTQHCKLFRQATLVKMQDMVNQVENGEALSLDTVMSQLDLSVAEQKVFGCVFEDAFRMAQLMTSYLWVSRL